MKLYAVRLFSRNWHETIAFYRDIVELPVFYMDEQLGWAQFDVGGVYLGVERVQEDDREGMAMVGRFVGVSLRVDDLQARYQTLKDRGVPFTGPPEAQHWGGTLAHFSDPDGNVLTLLG